MIQDVEAEMFVEVNSLEDFARGKKLFSGCDDLLSRGHETAEFVSMGILEGGTLQGKTAIMFLFKSKNTGYSICQIPLSVMNALTGMANSANLSFQKTKPNREEQN